MFIQDNGEPTKFRVENSWGGKHLFWKTICSICLLTICKTHTYGTCKLVCKIDTCTLPHN